MTEPKPVTLTHPDASRSIKVSREQVGMYESQGWVVKPDPAPKPKD